MLCGGAQQQQQHKICSYRSSSSNARQGKRDKYRYEVECVIDVPIGCILNR